MSKPRKPQLTYRVVADVPSSALTTVMQVIEGTARIIKVEPVEGRASPGARQVRYVNGKRNKGISGFDLLIKSLRGQVRGLAESDLRGLFEANGFSPNSLSPVLSRAVKAKKVVWDGEGRARLASRGK